MDKKDIIRKIIREEYIILQEEALVDQIYKILEPIKGFSELGLDQQGEVSMKIVQILNKYGLK